MSQRNKAVRRDRVISSRRDFVERETPQLSYLPRNKNLKFSLEDVLEIGKALYSGDYAAPLKKYANQALDKVGLGALKELSGHITPELITKLGKKGLRAVGLLPRNRSTVQSTSTEPVVVKEVIKAEANSGMMTGTLSYGNPIRAPRITSQTRDTRTISGCDLLTAITAPGGGFALGTVLFTTLINPAMMGTRIKKFASSWEKYRLSGKFILAPGCGTNVNGSLLSAIDYDPKDPIPSNGGITTVRQVASMAGSVVTPLRDANVQVINLANEMGELFIDNDESQERFTSVGRYVLAAASAIDANAPVGNIYFDWTIKVWIPQVDDGITTGDCTYLGYTGSMNNASRVGSFVQDPLSDLNSIQQDWENRAQAKMLLPPGTFRVSVSISSATGLSFSDSLITVEKSVSSQKTPGIAPAYGWGVVNSAGSASAATAIVYCTTPFVCCLCGTMTAGAWSGMRIHVNAMTSNPFASSFKALCRLYDNANSASKQTTKIDALKATLVSKDEPTDRKEAKSPSVRNNYFGSDTTSTSRTYEQLPSSTSSTSSSSSSSSSSPTLKGAW